MKFLCVFVALASVLLALMQQADAAKNCSYRKPGCNWLMVQDPVCGVNGCNYGNAGEASCGGTQVAYKGRCNSS